MEIVWFLTQLRPARFSLSQARDPPHTVHRLRVGDVANGQTEFMIDSGIGAPVKRKEDERHLHARGRFVSDILLPNLREVAFPRSPLAHGCIRGIDIPSDLKSRVYTAADIERNDGDRRARLRGSGSEKSGATTA